MNLTFFFFVRRLLGLGDAFQSVLVWWVVPERQLSVLIRPCERNWLYPLSSSWWGGRGHPG